MNSGRAVQFMPFAALKGYFELINEKQKVIVKRHVFAEEGAKELSYKMLQVRRGIMVKATYYRDGGYVEKTGMVSDIDFIFRTLTIVTEKIDFDDILNVSGEKIEELPDCS